MLGNENQYYAFDILNSIVRRSDFYFQWTELESDAHTRITFSFYLSDTHFSLGTLCSSTAMKVNFDLTPGSTQYSSGVGCQLKKGVGKMSFLVSYRQGLATNTLYVCRSKYGAQVVQTGSQTQTPQANHIAHILDCPNNACQTNPRKYTQVSIVPTTYQQNECNANSVIF